MFYLLAPGEEKPLPRAYANPQLPWDEREHHRDRDRRSRDYDDHFRDSQDRHGFERDRDRERSDKSSYGFRQSHQRSSSRNGQSDRDRYYEDRERDRGRRLEHEHRETSSATNQFYPRPVSSSGHGVTGTMIENKVESITVEDLLCDPGRKGRPERIVVIVRGPPGAGKTYVSKLMKVECSVRSDLFFGLPSSHHWH